MRIFGVILAGGEGRRMGGADKALLRLGGVTLAERAAARLGPQVARLAISANGDPVRLGFLGLPVLPDPPDMGPSRGPLSGVLAALDWAAAAGAAAVASVAVDTPFFPADVVARLGAAAASAGGGPALAESGGRCHPTFGLWPVGLRHDLRAALARGEARVAAFADRHGAARAVFAADDAFLNLNTPADLARAEAAIGGAA